MLGKGVSLVIWCWCSFSEHTLKHSPDDFADFRTATSTAHLQYPAEWAYEPPCSSSQKQPTRSGPSGTINPQTGSDALRLAPSIAIHVAVPNTPPHRRRGADPDPPLQRQARPPRSQLRRGLPPRDPAREGTLRTHAPPRKFLGCTPTNRDGGYAPARKQRRGVQPRRGCLSLISRSHTIALVWVSSGDATAVAVKGFRFIHATPNSFYLDCGAGGWVGGKLPRRQQLLRAFQDLAERLHLRPAREPDCRASAACARRAAENSPARRTLTLLPDPARPRPRRSLWSGPGGNVSAALPRLHELGYRSRNRGVQTIALRPFACDLTV
ncbi:hypothetical protein EDB85DRAFT_1889054 [Lactarius pseudohatsudake]|nr:hypothetical protein EDB85DRAFT_1889054 [Lactarius pseudohatsudake]